MDLSKMRTLPIEEAPKNAAAYKDWKPFIRKVSALTPDKVLVVPTSHHPAKIRKVIKEHLPHSAKNYEVYGRTLKGQYHICITPKI